MCGTADREERIGYELFIQGEKRGEGEDSKALSNLNYCVCVRRATRDDRNAVALLPGYPFSFILEARSKFLIPERIYSLWYILWCSLLRLLLRSFSIYMRYLFITWRITWLCIAAFTRRGRMVNLFLEKGSAVDRLRKML